MKQETKSDIAMRINIFKSGEIEVVDDAGGRLDPMTSEKLGRTLAGKEFKSTEICTVFISNPCGWVCVGGNWYWRHW